MILYFALYYSIMIALLLIGVGFEQLSKQAKNHFFSEMFDFMAGVSIYVSFIMFVICNIVVALLTIILLIMAIIVLVSSI